MANTVLMPKAGISVESCIIGTWRKKVGDTVAMGEILFDYETDKAVFECESTAEGTLLEMFYNEGDEVPCMIPVCAIGQPGEDVSSLRPDGAAPAAAEAPAAEAAPAAAAAPAEKAAATGKAGEKISPRAQGLADTLHVDASAAVPTGPYGRVIARDIEALAAENRNGNGIGGRCFGGAAAPAAAAVENAEPEYTDKKMSKIRKTIAAGMTASLQNMAQLTISFSFDATQLLALRKLYKEKGEALGLSSVSINDIILFAVSRTLPDFPELNSTMPEKDVIRTFKPVHLGVAVDTPRGLMVPTVSYSDLKSVKQISSEVKELAASCKAGNISPDLLSGATFTVTNLGSFGVESFTPVINPPQVAILGVAGTTTRVREGKNGIETYPAMGLCLTIDHRALDGGPAAKFMQQLCKNLENIQLLMAL